MPLSEERRCSYFSAVGKKAKVNSLLFLRSMVNKVNLIQITFSRIDDGINHMLEMLKKVAKLSVIINFSSGLPVLADDSEAAARSLSFAYGYCQTIQAEVAQQHGLVSQVVSSIEGQERSFSAGSFAAKQDILLDKYMSLAAFNYVCEALTGH